MGCGAEDLVFLKNEAAELRKLGAQWNLTEDEITKCIEEALSKTNEKQKAKLQNSPKNVARKCWRNFLVALKIVIYAVLGLIIVVCGVLTASSVSESADKALSQVLQPYSYEIMRAVRLAFLPFHHIGNLTQFYNSECIVDNPYFLEPEMDCHICGHFKKVKEINATNFTSGKFTAYVNTFKPALIKGTLSSNVTYADLRTLYLKNMDNFDNTLSSLESTVPEIGNVDQLFQPDRSELLNASNKLQIHWQTKTVKASASLRKLFPRPQFLPERTEIMLEKHLLLDGRETPTYELPSITTPTQLYILASGKRRVLVRPLPQCKKTCTSMLVFLEAGDALMYHRDMYRLFIAANQHGPSLGYLIPFAM